MAADMAVSVTVGAILGQTYRKVFQDAKSRLKQIGQEHKETQKKLRAVGGLLKYQQEIDTLRAKQGKLTTAEKKALEAAQKRFKQAGKAAKSYGLEVGKAAEQHKKLVSRIGSLDRERRAIERKERAGGNLGAMRARLMGAAGVAYGVGRMVGDAMEREEQAQYLRTVINAPDKDAAVGRALDHARDFSRRSLASDEEVLEIQYALNSAGLAEEVARAGSEVVHRLAKVTRGAPGQVGEIFGVAFNNMAGSMEGTASEKMDRIANVLAKTQFRFQIRDFGQLGESMKYAASTAVNYQISLEQAANAVGALNSAGLEGSMAGTAFQAMMRSMTKASEEFGFEIARDERGELDLVQTLARAKEALDGLGLSTDERADVLQKVFGDEGMRGVVPLLDSVDKLKAGLADIQAASGSNLVSDEYTRFLDGGAAQWKMLGQNVKQVGEIFGNTLLPALTKAVGWLAHGAAWVSRLIERFPVVGRLAAALAVGIGLVTVAAAAWAGAMWIANAAMLANPIGLTVAAIVAGAALIYAVWDPIQGAITAVWEKLKQLGDLLKGIGERIKNSAVGRAFQKLFGIDPAEDDDAPAAPNPSSRKISSGASGRRSRRAGKAAAAAVGAMAMTTAAAAPVDTPAANPPPAATVGAAVVAPDFDGLEAKAKQIAGSMNTARAGAAEPKAGAAFDLAGLEGRVGKLTRLLDGSAGEVAALPDLPATPGLGTPAAAGGRPVGITVNAEIVIQTPPGADAAWIAREIERQLAEIMREAATEAGLAEADGA